jgi:hypothetical protein
MRQETAWVVTILAGPACALGQNPPQTSPRPQSRSPLRRAKQPPQRWITPLGLPCSITTRYRQCGRCCPGAKQTKDEISRAFSISGARSRFYGQALASYLAAIERARQVVGTKGLP